MEWLSCVWTPQLIPLAELQDHLVYLNREVKRKYPNFEVKNMLASRYYGESFASAHAVGDDFFVILHIPLTSHIGENLPVYEVTTMRVPIDPDSDEETTEILNLPPYVGISSNGESYITVDSRDHLHCIGNNLKNCPVQFLRRSTSDNSCLMTILRDRHEEEVLRNCDVMVHMEVNTTPKIVSRTEQVSLLYNHPSSAVPIPGRCVPLPEPSQTSDPVHQPQYHRHHHPGHLPTAQDLEMVDHGFPVFPNS